jgi:hypothetical protein
VSMSARPTSPLIRFSEINLVPVSPAVGRTRWLDRYARSSQTAGLSPQGAAQPRNPHRGRTARRESAALIEFAMQEFLVDIRRTSF